MSKFHKTVSRRDFMKALGLGAAGLGAAAAATPVIHDLDELVSTANYDTDNINQPPWWVKNRDFKNPNVEILINGVKVNGKSIYLNDPADKYDLFVEKGIMTEDEADAAVDNIPDYVLEEGTVKLD